MRKRFFQPKGLLRKCFSTVYGPSLATVRSWRSPAISREPAHQVAILVITAYLIMRVLALFFFRRWA